MAEAAELRTVRRGLEAVYRDLHRSVWRQPLHVREQFPARQGPGQLPGDLQRLQAALGPLQREREDGAVLEDGDGFLSAAIAASLIRHWCCAQECFARGLRAPLEFARG